MANASKLAAALERARKAADQYQANIVHSTDLSRTERELLVHTSWLKEIIKGWYTLTRPDLADGDSTSWYSNFWDFLRIYLSSRYDDNYCLSAEASLDLHIGSTITPKQIIVIVQKGGNLLKLPYDTSLLTYSDKKNLPETVETLNHLRVMSLPLALCRVTPKYFIDNAENIEVALRSIRSTAEISRVIIAHGFVRAAERIVGAYQALSMDDKAEEILNSLRVAGIKIKPTNPFEKTIEPLFIGKRTYQTPFAARIEVIWAKYREDIIKLFPEAPGLSKNPKNYLARVDEIYEYDAYNSLSIEGYQVTEELIHRVKSRRWNPAKIPQDENTRNALAAKGYFEAFKAVKKTLRTILSGKSPGECLSKGLSIWYQELFSPAVDANIISAVDLVGYRTDRVYIRNSRHAPPPKEFVLDAMETFFACLQNETNAAVRAVLGHYIFVYIHPYMDGNGRIARFILNTMLASGGYPWTVVQLKNRRRYIDALEAAHVENNIKLFTQFIIDEMNETKGAALTS